jgi:hypothetical protein
MIVKRIGFIDKDLADLWVAEVLRVQEDLLKQLARENK